MIRKRGNRYVVEVYDPRVQKKVNVSARKLGMKAPKNMSEAKALERKAYADMETVRPGQETVEHFAERWTEEFTEGRNASTLRHNKERVKKLTQDFKGRAMSSITREEAEAWSLQNRSRVREVRAMFNDALRIGVVRDNPFKGVGYARKGRRDIEVLSAAEIQELCACAVRVHGPAFGQEFAAMIVWAAYTGMRPGEIMAARFRFLDGDLYTVKEQFNTKLGLVTPPKHESVGEIFVPQPALTAVRGKPRHADGDDLIFRTKRGKMFSAVTLRDAWVPVRAAFGRPDLDFYELRHFCAAYMLNELEIEPWIIAKQMRHADNGKLVVQLYGHPDRKRALGRIRLAYTDSEAIQAPRQVASDGADGPDLYA